MPVRPDSSTSSLVNALLPGHPEPVEGVEGCERFNLIDFFKFIKNLLFVFYSVHILRQAQDERTFANFSVHKTFSQFQTNISLQNVSISNS